MKLCIHITCVKMANFFLLNPQNLESDEPRPIICWGMENNICFQDVNQNSLEDILQLIEVLSR